MGLSVDDFAALVKQKYPVYADMDNGALTQAIIAKHPEYASQVTGFEPDVRTSIAMRKANPPPTATGDPNAGKNDPGVGGYLGAAVQGVGAALGVPSTVGEAAADFALPGLAQARQAVNLMQGVAAPSAAYASGRAPTGRENAGAVPIVGAPVFDVSRPAAAVAEGRPPTSEENLQATQSGASLATMAALPKIVPKIVPAAAKMAGALAEHASAISPALKNAAVARYSEALGAADNPRLQEAVIPRMMAEGRLATEGHLDQLNQEVDAHSQHLIDMEDQHGAVPQKVVPIIQNLQGLKGEFLTPDSGVPTSPEALKLINKLTGQVRQAAPRDTVTTADLVALRDRWDQVAKSGGAFNDGTDLDPAAKAAVYQKAAAVLRDPINSVEPLGKANNDLSYAIQARDLIDGAVRGAKPQTIGDFAHAMIRPGLMKWSTAGMAGGGVVGAALGHPVIGAEVGGALGNRLGNVVEGPGMQTRIALAQSRLGNALEQPSAAGRIVGPHETVLPSDAPIRNEPVPPLQITPGNMGNPPKQLGPAPTEAPQGFQVAEGARDVGTRLGQMPEGDSHVIAPVSKPPTGPAVKPFTTAPSQPPSLAQLQAAADAAHPSIVRGVGAGRQAPLTPLQMAVWAAQNDAPAVKVAHSAADTFGHDAAVHNVLTDAVKAVGPKPDLIRQYLMGRKAVYVAPDGTETPIPYGIVQGFINGVK